MVKKVVKGSSKPSTTQAAPHMAASVKESAQQIWLAGLGAFAKAQQEGTKVFETLVKEGLSVQRKTQVAAEERIADATSRMSNMASEITSKATGQWDKLESIFEDRVARTLNKLGVPTAKDIDALIDRIDELNQTIKQMQPKPAPAAPRTAAKKAAVAPAPKAAAADKPVKPKATSKKPVAKKVSTKTPATPAATDPSDSAAA